MNWLKTNIAPLAFLLLAIVLFFSPVFFGGKLPLPVDSLVGLYHPYRDYFAQHYPNGIPYKNFLLTDPVRQQYLWKQLAVDQLKQARLPWWNPYTHSGTPLLANFQAGVFYPLNLLFIGLAFPVAWSFYIVIQVFLGAIFCYLFLRRAALDARACVIGALAFVFGGFFLVWLEWGNIGHTLLWLPLLLLSVDRLVDRPTGSWALIFIMALVSQIFAGHLQTSFYVTLTVTAYAFSKLTSPRGVNSKRRALLFIVPVYLLFILLTAIQWRPTLELIRLSAREFDQVQLGDRADWFLPWQHLIQFVAPDFFGNPATLNYWGVWNYSEFVGYVGILPLVFAFAALFSSRKHLTGFLTVILVGSLLFALPTPLAKLPFLLKLPFLSQAQPSRLLSLVTFALSGLAAIGFNDFLKRNRYRPFKLSLILVGTLILLLWLATLPFFPLLPKQHLLVVRRNLILPTAIFLVGSAMISVKRRRPFFISVVLLLITAADLLRFAQKYTPFSPRQYLFPQTAIIDYLARDQSLFRIMAVDRRILPPNVILAYKLQTIEGYDPLYLKAYADLITLLETGRIQDQPVSFNRIISPGNIASSVIDSLNVKYILSLTDLTSSKLELVKREGQTRLYQNRHALPRARFTQGPGAITVVSYQPAEITLKVSTDFPNTLVLADMMYPGWQAAIDGQASPLTPSPENFRTLAVPAGRHIVRFFFLGFGKTSSR